MTAVPSFCTINIETVFPLVPDADVLVYHRLPSCHLSAIENPTPTSCWMPRVVAVLACMYNTRFPSRTTVCRFDEFPDNKTFIDEQPAVNIGTTRLGWTVVVEINPPSW